MISNYIDKLAAVQRWIEDSGLPERDILSVRVNIFNERPSINLTHDGFAKLFTGRQVKCRCISMNNHYEIIDGDIEVTSCQRIESLSLTVTL